MENLKKGTIKSLINYMKGRKTVMTRMTLQKLEYAFRLGCTDKEACIEAGIVPQTLYNYQSKNPDFMESKELWKSDPILRARKTIVERISTDANLAMKYLEKKLPEEFGVNQRLLVGVAHVHMTPADLVRSIEERNAKIRA